MAEKFSFGEGACLSKAPLFCGMKYELWCIRMKFFVESIDRKIWNVITNNYLMPIFENVSSEREHLDCVAMNIIVFALDSNELLKVSECSSSKEMWNTLEEYHKNPRSALMDKEESSAESFSSESKKKGHIKTECLNKKKKNFKKHEKKGKSIRAYNDDSSSSSSSKEEKANICLIAERDDESCSSSNVSLGASLNAENYSELFEAFQETHDEANQLVLSNNRLKELNSWLEKRVKALEEELEKSKSDFENLKTHYKKKFILQV